MHHRVLDALAVGLYLLRFLRREYVDVVPAEGETKTTKSAGLTALDLISSGQSFGFLPFTMCLGFSNIAKARENIPSMESDNAESLEPTH